MLSFHLHQRWSVSIGGHLVALLACACFLTARAQYRFDHWTADTGLPQNIITAIQQTPEGYLWVATLDGLARFDGVRFTIFNKSNTPGIRSNRFSCLYQDAQGDLWAGTEMGGVTRYHQGRFSTYTKEHGLTDTIVRGLRGDAQGHLWVLSGNKVLEWNPSAGRFSEREMPQFFAGADKVAWTGENIFGGATQTGLYLLARGNWTHLPLPPAVRGSLTNIAQADDGTIWIATAGGPVFRYKNGQVTSFPLPNQPASAARPLTTWRDRSGKAWEMEIVDKLFRKLAIPSSGKPESVTLNTLYEDRDGNLWLGTDGQGLYHIRKQIIQTISQEQGLPSRNVYPIYEDRTGAIWVGMWDGGLSQIKAGKITNFRAQDGLSEGGVLALSEDQTRRLWVATATDLQIFEQGRFRSVKAQYPSPQPRLNVIYQERTGAMWFGMDQGLFRHDNGELQYFTLQDGGPSVSVRAIIEAAGGGVWVGCYGGLIRWQEGKRKSWTEQEGLPRALYEDRDGVLWIGTYDSGLGRFKDGKLHHTRRAVQ